jgi:hypothetical protein
MADVCIEKAVHVLCEEEESIIRLGEEESYPEEWLDPNWLAPGWVGAAAKEKAVEWMLSQGVKSQTYARFHTEGVDLGGWEDWYAMGYDFCQWHKNYGMGG